MAAEVNSASEHIRLAAVRYRIKITPKLVLSILGPFFLDKIREQVAAVAQLDPATRGVIALARDTGGVTTGPVTVPLVLVLVLVLVLALGLGVGTSVGVADGFGMLAMASIGPILTVLVLGLVVSRMGAKAPAAPPMEDHLVESPEEPTRSAPGAVAASEVAG